MGSLEHPWHPPYQSPACRPRQPEGEQRVLCPAPHPIPYSPPASLFCPEGGDRQLGLWPVVLSVIWGRFPEPDSAVATWGFAGPLLSSHLASSPSCSGSRPPETTEVGDKVPTPCRDPCRVWPVWTQTQDEAKKVRGQRVGDKRLLD